MKNKKSGFTLIEIMVAVVIIGLLAGMGTLAVSKTIENYRNKTVDVELEIISTAVLKLAWDTGKWPNGTPRSGQSGEVVPISATSAGLMSDSGRVFGDEWKGPYYDGEAIDPWDDDYVFDPNYKGVPVVRSKNRPSKPVVLK